MYICTYVNVNIKKKRTKIFALYLCIIQRIKLFKIYNHKKNIETEQMPLGLLCKFFINFDEKFIDLKI